MVFVGVTLAFMLDSWRDDQKRVELERNYLVSFSADLERDKHDIDSLLAVTDRVREDAIRLGGMLAEGASVHPDTVTALLSGAMTIAQLPRNRSTYVSISSSGNLGVITSYALREHVVTYYQLLDRTELAVRVSNDFLNDYIIPLFVDHLDFVTQKWEPADVVSSSRFRNVVIGYGQLATQNVAAYEKVAAARDTLAQLVHRELDTR